MKTIIYRSSQQLISGTNPIRFTIDKLGICYLFLNSTTETSLKDHISLYHSRRDTVFLIPDALKRLFRELFEKVLETQPLTEKQFDDNELGGNRNTNAVKEEMVENTGNKLSASQIDFIEIFLPPQNLLNQELNSMQQLLDSITQDNRNEVDAIFVTLTFDNPKYLLYQSATRDSERKVDVASYGAQIAKFSDLLKKMDPEGSGLEEAIFYFKKGMTSITRLGNKKALYLFMVSTAVDAGADVAYIRNLHLEAIKEELRKAGKIDT